ncbi:MAG: hypothetical protein E3J86_15370 [Candidatus Thorarchaeota archaeon]|nr:MAG: hypothetical protein E3J86_15370 [Candidatus Thorarchaeota archaeon]
MSSDSEKTAIRDIVNQFFDNWSSREFDEHPISCHPKALFYVKSYDVPPRPMSLIKEWPDFVGIHLKGIKQVNLGNKPVASVLIEYEMTENRNGEKRVIGEHSSFLNMMKIDGVWTITGIVDYGVEI